MSAPGGLLLVVALAAPCLAACVDGPSPSPPEDAATVWDRGLRDHVETPAVAERRSKSLRLAAVSPPGSPEFAAFDELIKATMQDRGVPAGSFALLRDGRLRYASGYGYSDNASTRPATHETLFRFASVTKPMTAAVVTMQVAQGLYAWTDPVFCLPQPRRERCLLDIPVHPARPIVDPRIADITVADLRAHRGGWSEYAADELFFWGRPVEIANLLGVPSPPHPWRVAQYLLGSRLDAAPGTTYAYCNVCYVFLGLVAEAAARATLPALFDAYLFRPLELGEDLAPGRTLPSDRPERETFYVCEFGTAPNVYPPHDPACHPDGGFHVEGLLAAGGLIGTAAAVGAVYEVYAPNGSVRNAAPTEDGHYGGLPGTAAIARTLQDDGSVLREIQFVALFNRLEGPQPTFLGEPYSIHDLDRPLGALATAWAIRDNAKADAAG